MDKRTLRPWHSGLPILDNGMVLIIPLRSSSEAASIISVSMGPGATTFVLIGSIADVIGTPGYGVYGASKAALRSFARTWTSSSGEVLPA
jgi:NAD(P)-dependent dehydrogenase (short-subunit alcohol dehydrogenase family)